jgi:hypothetical protein
MKPKLPDKWDLIVLLAILLVVMLVDLGKL